ncbi:helicase associated domain-containing protein [Streptomyces cyaneofuscatus]|uniref:helicase associated domain-containing protein n=1 Tax=Streptomyces cyaneofuscatus TaxID=66883 RepID=UPI0036AED04B
MDLSENLEAAKAYYADHWTLCAPRSAAALDRPVGQWLSNLRRPGALEDHPEWKAALEAVDAHWNPAWSAEWQRHYAALRELVADEEGQADAVEVLPGFTVHGMDVGKWLVKQRQRAVWAGLMEGQRELLAAVGVVPLPPEQAKPAKTPRKAVSAFEKGVAALGQYKAREGSVKVPRAHVERLDDGSEVKLGVFLSNSKSRRAKLSADRLSALAALGLEWAREG